MAMSTRASRSFSVMLASRSLGIETVISTMTVAQRRDLGSPETARFGAAVIFRGNGKSRKDGQRCGRKPTFEPAFLYCLSAPCAGHHAARKSSGADTKTDTKTIKNDMIG